MFKYTLQRKEDGFPMLLDLPKECHYNIMSRLTDHRDLVNLGATCSYFNDLMYDDSIWRDLCLYQFTEKQLCPFVDDVDFGWQQSYEKCIRSVISLKNQNNTKREIVQV